MLLAHITHKSQYKPDNHGRRGSLVDNTAETQVDEWESEESPSTPSVGPETPPSDHGGQQAEEEVSVEQRHGVGEGAAGVCGDAVAAGGHRGQAVSMGAAEHAMADAAAAVVIGAEMLMQECEEALCGEVESAGMEVESKWTYAVLVLLAVVCVSAVFVLLDETLHDSCTLLSTKR